MAQKFSNAARSKLAAAITAASTALTLEAGGGARFPVAGAPDWWYLTLEDDAGGFEIVKVTAHAAGSDALTVTRGQDGTVARAFAAGTVAGIRVTAADADGWAAAAGAVAPLVASVDGLRDIPGNVQSAAYTLALTDRGASVDTMAGVTVPTNAAVAFPVGATAMVTNIGSAAITITAAAGVTLRLAGTTTTGNRTLASYGVATLRKVAADAWIVAGAGVS